MSEIAIVVFPGTNCERDAYHVLKNVFHQNVSYHWHNEPIKKEFNAVILPGGFSYGDYLRAGALAKISPAVQSLGDYIDKGGMVLGICNGFQILTEAGYLPGALIKNASLRFQCEDVHVQVTSTNSLFLRDLPKGKVYRWAIAHSEGKYIADPETLRSLQKNGQIALTYCGPNGESEEKYNANGSAEMIAGITNEKGNVLGFMPHPERGSEEILHNKDGYPFFESMLKHL
jgi:phosphoribosylformylglycinamidine synthase